EPGIVLDLVFKLSRRPTRIAESEHGAGGTLVARDGLENVEGRGQTDALVDRERRVLDEKVGRMQNESALRLDRSALKHLDGTGAPRQLDTLVGGNDVELDQQVRKIDVRRRLVDDDAHG